MAAFVTVLLCSNLIGASKRTVVGGFTFGAGVLFFPISYVFGDILTEVYGYAMSRRIIWSGFAGLFLMVIFYEIAQLLPPAPFWEHQKAFETTLAHVPRIVAASMIASSDPAPGG